MKTVKLQYEKYPYPPISPLALPRRNEGKDLLCPMAPGVSDKNQRILIAGCGTFEPTLVAQVYPKAQEIIAVDLSRASLWRARLRYGLARLTRQLGPVQFIEADLMSWAEFEKKVEIFDTIIASNVLHHVEDPEALLSRLSSHLKPGGRMRIVTYPKASRLWMRNTSGFLKLHHLSATTPRLKTEAWKLIQSLPVTNPLRLTFENHQEAATATGIVDAFLHACETPLGPLQWGHACQNLGLELISETQNETSRSSFLDEIIPEARVLNPWVKLEILDRLLELCANPVLWLKKSGSALPTLLPPYVEHPTPVSVTSELRSHLLMAETLLSPVGVSLREVFDRFKREVGPRVSPFDENQTLPGLSITDYELTDILSGQTE